MEVPRGFTRCDECKDGRISKLVQAGALEWPEDRPCLSCSGSGLVPTEKLREEATAAIEEVRESVVPGATHIVGPTPEADAVLRKVAEHIREGR